MTLPFDSVNYFVSQSVQRMRISFSLTSVRVGNGGSHGLGTNHVTWPWHVDIKDIQDIHVSEDSGDTIVSFRAFQ
jgi:hypothetical protein